MPIVRNGALNNFLLLCIMACSLLGCSHSYHWTKSHPSYHSAPYGNLAVVNTDKAFVLTRSNWFAKKLEISQDSIQLKLTQYCSKLFLNELAKGYGNLIVLPKESLDPFPEESQKLDNRIFMKGKIPEQGISIKDSSGNIPPRILILHEVILGTDLQRENYFDYALIHNESSDVKTSKNITAVFSYTLWDNEKQRALFNAVDQIDIPIIKPSLSDFETITKQMVNSIRHNLSKGVVK